MELVAEFSNGEAEQFMLNPQQVSHLSPQESLLTQAIQTHR
jgi:hypothetical protein